MCDIWQIDQRQEITPREVSGWLDEWRRLGVRRVVLSGGEPLMHSALWEICAPLHQAGIGITLLSTGLLLKRWASDVVRYVDDVVVSLDGPPEVHDRIRNIPRAYQKLAAGVAAVRAANGAVSVTGRCTVQRANYDALRRTVAAAHDLRLDRISFLAADVSTGAFNRPGGWSAERVREVALSAGDLPGLHDELSALERERADDFAAGYIAENPEKLWRRLYQYFRALLGTGDFVPIECNAPWVSSVIETDGTVRPCFFQPALGNIRSAGGLEAVLNAPQAVAWRRGLDTHRNAISQKCVCSLQLRASDATIPAV
jgi:MoaA/NifB/PqqE/SkfB family radical SAM enzyme